MATTSPILFASSKLAQALDDQRIPYAIMGGAACSILGSSRETQDIDLCVDMSGNRMTVDQLNTHLINLPGFTKVDEDNIGYYIPAVVVPNHSRPIPLELFDPTQWPLRPQYALVTSHRVAKRLPDGINAYIFTPAWLLREKIATVQERLDPNRLEKELQDIDFLSSTSIIPTSEYGTGLLDLRNEQPPYYATHLRAFLVRTDVPQDLRTRVGRIFRL